MSTTTEAVAVPQPRLVDRVVAGDRAARWKVAAVVATVLVVVVAHAVNMFGYPYLEDDEGTYVGQAWALLTEGRLAPYTYFYDHAPGGWIQLAGWLFLTGGPHGVFGGPLASGRVFMLVLQVVSTVLVIAAGRKLTGSLWAGLLAALLFGLSPYGLLYHRRVLLDNITTVWMLASFVLLLGDRVRLLRVWLSALALGVAIWSKEIAVTAIPAFAVLAARQAPRHSRLMALVSWPLVCLSVVSVYPLMALLKGELFPSGSLLGGTNPHVSLLCSLEWQSARGADGGILNPGSAFWTTFGSWAAKDPVLVLGGSAAALVSVAVFRRHRGLSMLGWSVLTFWAFLGRGGVILDFYLVPLLPFLAIGLAAAAWRLAGLLLQARWSTAGPRVTAAALAVVTILSVGGQTVQLAQPANAAMWTADPAKGQREAIDWVEQHLPSGSRIVLDMYMWVDLHDRADGGRPFTHAEYYWKAATDPAVKQGEFEGDWRNVDYVITTPQLTQDTAAQGWGIIQQALNHSRPVAHFNTGLDVTVRHVSPDYSAGGFTWKQPQKSAVAPSCMQGP